MAPARPNNAHAAISAPGSSSKQKKMPPTAQTQSMTKDHIRTRRFLSKTDGGGFPRVALYAVRVIFRSRKKRPTPTGKRKKLTAQMTLANWRMNSNSRSSSRRYMTRLIVGEYIREPAMPMHRPRMFRTEPTKRYRPLHVGANSASLRSSTFPKQLGNARPMPHMTYPAVQ